jgi:hypothetical protein
MWQVINGDGLIPAGNGWYRLWGDTLDHEEFIQEFEHCPILAVYGTWVCVACRKSLSIYCLSEDSLEKRQVTPLLRLTQRNAP